MKDCIVCGTTLPFHRSRYCSDACTTKGNNLRDRRRRKLKARARTGSVVTCALPSCDQTFVQPPNGRKFCSSQCLYWAHRKAGAADTDGTWTFPCPDCGLESKSRMARPSRCRACSVLLERARTKRKHGKRHGVNLLTVSEIAKRDGALCHICHKVVDLTLSGNHRMGPTVEHIICHSWPDFDPLDPYNEVLAHRACNSRRGNREPSQMVLALT